MFIMGFLPKLGQHDYKNFNYIGTQANKLNQAVEAMNELMANLQISAQFENAKNNKCIETNSISKNNEAKYFLQLFGNEKLGFDYDIRKDIYNEIQNLDLNTLTNFYNQKVKPVKYNTAIIGKKENIDLEAIKK